MLERKITKTIEDWFNNNNEALLIDGARQIGKTTIIEEFFKNKDVNFIEINLHTNNLALKAFNQSTSPDQLLLRISMLSNAKLIDNKTVIFIDEIQEANDAITPIKFLVKNHRYKFIFSGSLLGIKMQEILSIPIGFLKVVQMYPMDFEEFIKALGVKDDTIKYLNQCFQNREQVDDIVHTQMIELFKTYLIVGGMPQAVDNFVKTRDIYSVNSVLYNIDYGYKGDVSKYQYSNKLMIQEIYDLIPSQLNCQNKRFILKELNEKARFYQYETSFTWLKYSGIGLFVHNVNKPVFPLLASKERTLFKLFLCDIGLLSYKLFNGKQIEILNNDTHLNYGEIYEAVVAQELTAHGFNLFYNSDKKRGEIDFLIEQNNNVVPIEIKSGKDYKRHSALFNLLSNIDYNINEGYVFCNGNIEQIGKKIYLPIYMIMFLSNEQPKNSMKIDIDISKLI